MAVNLLQRMKIITQLYGFLSEWSVNVITTLLVLLMHYEIIGMLHTE